MRRPWAYLRKSRVFRGKDIVSPEMQLGQVEHLARGYGDEHLTVVTDLNVSGKRRDRPGFRELLGALERDEVSAVYSYSLSRLSRSVRDIVQLAELCARRGVPIRLARDQDPDPTTASGKMMLTFLAAMAQYEADVASERARDTVEARRARGEKLGPRYYPHPEVVAAAFAEAGSANKTALLLNERGVPTSTGRGMWSATAVRLILDRQGLLPPHVARGVSPKATWPLSRLLRCHCGTFLSGKAEYRGTTVYTFYVCHKAKVTPNHGKTMVPAHVMMDWARQEASYLDAGEPAVLGDADTSEQRAALEERRRLLNKALIHGMDEAEYDAEMESIEADLARLELAGQKLVSLDAVVWDRTPDLVNDQLRALWEYVQMDDQMRPPDQAEWRIKEWRRGPEQRQERTAAGVV